MGFCKYKELTINGKEVRSPEQQVWKNMQDIDMLKSFIKPIYQTTAELTTESTGVLIADTNVPEGTKNGWILTEDGLFFQIEDSNETSLLLLFLADLKGPQGEDGTDGQDGVTPSITATATIDANVGTPSVVVTKTGTDEAPTFTFAFHNLKGETGTSLISVEVVAVLPASGDTGTLYFVPNSGSAPNQYDEYIWVNNAWEKLGTQSIDLSNYIQKSNTSGLVKNDGTIDTTSYASINDISYSTSEVNTHAKWIDGRDIYKKTITLGTFTYTSSEQKIADLPSGIDLLVEVNVIVSNFLGDNFLEGNIIIAKRSDGIYAWLNDTWTTAASYITIYYVKSV